MRNFSSNKFYDHKVSRDGDIMKKSLVSGGGFGSQFCVAEEMTQRWQIHGFLRGKQPLEKGVAMEGHRLPMPNE